MASTLTPAINPAAPLYKPGRPSAEMDAKVLAYTQDIFSGARVSIRPYIDPENGEEYPGVDVAMIGTVEELVERSDRWFKSLSDVAPGFELEYCLLVNPQ